MSGAVKRGGIRRGALMLAVGALVATRSALAQCSMCGSAVGSSSRLGFGLNISIFFLLAVLFSLVGGLVVLAVRSGREPAGRAPARGGPPGDDRLPRRT